MKGKRSAKFMHRLTALITLWAFAFTTLAPSHDALSHAAERFVYPPRATGAGAVTNATLGTLDTTLLRNGIFDLVLTATDRFGASASDAVSLVVEGDMKVGHFTVAFKDLEIPLAGMPISVVRSYDSRDHCPGDFGKGWVLDVESIRVEKNFAMGDGWSLDVQGGDLLTPPVYQLVDDAGHQLVVRMPDGEVLRFAPKLVFNRPFNRLASVLDADGDDVASAWVGVGYDTPLALKFRARGGTRGATLEPRGFATSNPWVGGNSTVAAGASFYAGEPSVGAMQLAASPNEAQDADVMSDATGWRLVLKDKRVFLFDKDGRLERMTDSNGNTLSINRDGAGRVMSVSHSSGKAIVFHRDGAGRVERITDPAGNELKYGYDSLGRLAVFHDRSRETTEPASARYAYKQNSNLIEDIFDSKGIRAVRQTYDAQGRLISSTDAKGRATTFVHNVAGRTETVNRPLGQSQTMQYDDRGNILSIKNALNETTTFTYDADNNRLTSTDPLNRVTRYTYDAFGNMLSVEAPHKPTENAAAFTTRYTYNDRGDILSVTSPTGAVENRGYDARGNLETISDESGQIIASWVYDARGNAIREGDSFSEMLFDFNGVDQMTKMTDSTGRETTAEYDLNGQLTAMTIDGVRSVFTLDEEGRELGSDYGNGITSLFEYNAAGDNWTSASGPTLGRIEREFDTDGSVKSWKLPSGATTTFALDAAGRMASQTDGLGAVTSFTYDAAGRTTSVTDAATGATVSTEYDAAGQPTKTTDALNNETAFTYTPDGRPETVKNARNFLWEYRYTPNSVTVIDPLQRQKVSQFTAHGLPEVVCCGPGAPYQVTYLLNSGDDAEESPLTITDAGNHVRSFEYGDDGILTGVTDLAGNMFQFEYNAAFELSAVKYPSGAVAQSFTYDALDNPATITTGDGGVRSFTYGADNRVATETLPAGPVLSYTYDVDGRIASVAASNGESAAFTYNAANSPLTAQNNAGTTSQEYDVNGRLTKVTTPTGGIVSYEYDLNGRISKLTAKATATAPASVTQYRYDAVGNLDQITDPLGGVTTIEYDAVNRPMTRTLPNGIVTAYTYDSRDMIETIVHRRPDQSILASAVYERQGNGEPSRITREDGTYTDYAYDAAHRLTSEERRTFNGTLIEQIAYTYDVDGKRTSKTTGGSTATYTYGAGQRLTQAGSQAITYDAGGRVQTLGGITLGYTNHDHVATVSNAANGYSETFSHDALGRRIKGVSGGQERRFITAPMAGGLDAPHVIADGTGQALSTYVYTGSIPLMRIKADGQPEYYLTDAMGSVIGLAGNAATSVATFRYDGFGTPTVMTGTPSAVPGGDYRFQAHWQEAATGLYHMRARDYDPQTGRFLSRDPEPYTDKEPESLMPYAFANNNPMYYSDPTGRFTLVELKLTSAIQQIVRAGKTVSANLTRKRVTKKIAEAVRDHFMSVLEELIPFNFDSIFRNSGFPNSGDAFDALMRQSICQGVNKNMASWIWWEPGIVSRNGQVDGNGYQCNDVAPDGRGPAQSQKRGVSRPDLVISKGEPKANTGILVTEFKISGARFYKDYILLGKSGKRDQFSAILNYAKNSSWTKTAVFVAFLRGDKKLAPLWEKHLAKKAVGRGVLPLYFHAF
jgi:RHS repeat-associated protein